MTTETLENIVEVVKTRTLARDGARAFFMDNARRMWGLPERSAETPTQIQVSRKTTTEGEQAAQLPVEPLAPVNHPIERPGSPSSDWSAVLPWVVAGILSAVLLLLSTLMAWPESTPIDEKPATGAVVGDENSLFQYLEDSGEHRP